MSRTARIWRNIGIAAGGLVVVLFITTNRIVQLRLVTSIHHLSDVTYLAIDRPEANIIVFADGNTNVPTLRVKTTSGESPLETVVNLAVSHFELTRLCSDLRTRI